MKKNKYLCCLFGLAILLGYCSSCDKPAEIIENPVKVQSISTSKMGESKTLHAKKLYKNNEIFIANEDVNYSFIEENMIEFYLTINLDNPEAFGIDALRIKCDNVNAEILIDDIYKPIAKDTDGGSIVNWCSANPYEKTFSIRLDSDSKCTTVEITDIRLSGHELFLSKENNSNNFGNNILQDYKIPSDLLTKNRLSK